ncbi:hypothetical protein ACF064_32610 [Streptomyces sp. NPDC015492]|uniref:hypothetical protein n=1 Tax=Streptomyces sp. NPDC015492 TaxID=3364958 RepID=UPI0036F987C2
MKKNPLALACVSAFAGLSLIGSADLAAAQAEDAGDARTRLAIEHAVAGKADAADLKVIGSNAYLAASVPVRTVAGKPTVTTLKTHPAAKSSLAATYNQVCRAVDYPLTNISYLGEKIYTWHHKFSWCTANTQSGAEHTRQISVSPYDRYDYFTDKTSVVYPQAMVTDAVSAPVGGFIGMNTDGYLSSHYSHMARGVNLCFAQYACYASNLPQSKMTIGRDTVTVAYASPL